MTSQQDTDRLKKCLDKLYNIKGDCDPEIAQALCMLRQLINEGFVHTNTQITTQNLYDVLYPKLTAWKDKEVTKARIDELRHLRIPTQTLRDQVDDRIKQLQGGKR